VSIEAAGVGVSWLDTAGPLLVWVIVLSFVLVECALIIGLFLPGDSLLFGAGVVLAQHGSDANAWFLSGAALIVAVLGNQIGYYIGRSSGTKLIARRDGKVLNRHNLERAQRFLDRKGFFAIVAARWIPWIRTLAPLIAGAARMDPRRFMETRVIHAEGLAGMPPIDQVRRARNRDSCAMSSASVRLCTPSRRISAPWRRPVSCRKKCSTNPEGVEEAGGGIAG